jgi:phage regulator Rha-like protein
MGDSILVPVEKVDRAILFIRGKKVMLDVDIAEIYGVETRRLNEQVKRNIDRFPKDFMFQLTDNEKIWVISNCDHLQKLKYSRTNPYAFTEHGAIMLASVLNTTTAVKASVYVVRAFVRLREVLATHKELAVKLTELEAKYDKQFKIVFEVLKQLMSSPKKDRPKVGFKRSDEK